MSVLNNQITLSNEETLAIKRLQSYRVEICPELYCKDLLGRFDLSYSNEYHTLLLTNAILSKNIMSLDDLLQFYSIASNEVLRDDMLSYFLCFDQLRFDDVSSMTDLEFDEQITQLLLSRIDFALSQDEICDDNSKKVKSLLFEMFNKYELNSSLFTDPSDDDIIDDDHILMSLILFMRHHGYNVERIIETVLAENHGSDEFDRVQATDMLSTCLRYSRLVILDPTLTLLNASLALNTDLYTSDTTWIHDTLESLYEKGELMCHS